MRNIKTQGPLIASLLNLLAALLIIISIILIACGVSELYKHTVSPLLKAQNQLSKGFPDLITKITSDETLMQKLGFDDTTTTKVMRDLVEKWTQNHNDVMTAIGTKLQTADPETIQQQLMQFLNSELDAQAFEKLGISDQAQMADLSSLQTEYNNIISTKIIPEVIKVLSNSANINTIANLPEPIPGFTKENLGIMQKLLSSIDSKLLNEVLKTQNFNNIFKVLILYIKSHIATLFIGFILFASVWPLAFTTSLVLKFVRKNYGLKGGWGSIIWAVLYPLLGFIVHPILAITYLFRKKQL